MASPGLRQAPGILGKAFRGFDGMPGMAMPEQPLQPLEVRQVTLGPAWIRASALGHLHQHGQAHGDVKPVRHVLGLGADLREAYDEVKAELFGLSYSEDLQLMAEFGRAVLAARNGTVRATRSTRSMSINSSARFGGTNAGKS